MKKIFTTEDGVDIYPGDRYFSVKVKEYPQHPVHQNKKPIPLWSIAGPYINPEAHNPTGDIKYFSTRESAEEFVEQNKNNVL